MATITTTSSGRNHATTIITAITLSLLVGLALWSLGHDAPRQNTLSAAPISSAEALPNLQGERNSKYIYFTDRFGGKPVVERVRIADGKVEWVADLWEMRLVEGQFGSWFGLAPDDSPLVLRDVGIQDIYALNFQTP